MNIAAFLAYSLIVTFTPGPTNVLILATAQNRGVRRALEFAGGAALAFGLLLVLSAALNGALARAAPRLSGAVGLVGAAYMLYLAFKIWRSEAPEDEAGESGADRAGEGRRTFLAGFALQFANPKVIMFALTVVANFVAPHARTLPAMAGPVAGAIGIGWCALFSWVLLGAAFRRLLSAYRRQANAVMAAFLVYCAFAVSGLAGIWSS